MDNNDKRLDIKEN